MNRNYQKELDNIIAGHGQRREAPTLFLHSCCAPCSSYVLEYLSAFFRITVFYYNPNIYPAEEYEKRVEEQKNLIERLPSVYPIEFVEGAYDKERFYEMARGLELSESSHHLVQKEASLVRSEQCPSLCVK